MEQFDARQRIEALALLEQTAWDMDNYIRDLEAALRLALAATVGDFVRWEPWD
jgi:hypothetical protein